MGAGPLARNTPLTRSALQMRGSFAPIAPSDFSALSAISALVAPVSTRRSLAPGSESCAFPDGIRPERASARAPVSCCLRVAASPAPRQSMPLGDGADEERFSVTVTRVLRALVSRPGTCSSTSTWKFVPPKPKEETAARRGPSELRSQGCACWFT